MVQLPEVTDEKSEARKAGYETICQIGEERIRRAGKKVKEEAGFEGQDLDIGFRVLKLDSSNMENVFYTPEDFNEADLFNYVDNVKSDRTPLDLLFQVMPELDIELSAKIEEKGSQRQKGVLRRWYIPYSDFRHRGKRVNRYRDCQNETAILRYARCFSGQRQCS